MNRVSAILMYLVAAIAGIGLAFWSFVLIVESDYRGFLPSMRRTLRIDGFPDGNSLAFIVSEPTETLDKWEPVPGAIVIAVREQSMGRTIAPWSCWRASHWVYEFGADQYGSWHTSLNGFETEVGDRVDAFIRESIIPASPVLAMQPPMPRNLLDVEHHGCGSWTYWQRRNSIPGLVASIAVSLVIGAVPVAIVAVRRRSSSAHRTPATQSG
ncbi:MAG TPA: hypothetical protein VD971_12920 [Phycisphaerales bacterium]|nr:hypothetical protein [Phycisphaerales bacterium]